MTVATETIAQRTRTPKAAGPATWRQFYDLSNLLKAVADPTRLQVVLSLADGEQHVGALCVGTRQTQPSVSHHLAILRHSGIIQPRRRGKNNFYALTEKGARLAATVRGLLD